MPGRKAAAAATAAVGLARSILVSPAGAEPAPEPRRSPARVSLAARCALDSVGVRCAGG